jgi:hypothetical protein
LHSSINERKRPSTLFSVFSQTNKNFIVGIILVVAFSIADISVATLSLVTNLVPENNSSWQGLWSLVLYALMVPAFGIGSLLITQFVIGNNIESIGKVPNLRIISKTVTITQFVLTFLFSLTAIQVIFTSHYNTVILAISSTISLGISITILFLLSLSFFSWYRSNKNFVVLMYGLSTIAVAISLSLLVVLTDAALANLPDQRNSASEVKIYVFQSDVVLGNIQVLNAASNFANFLLLWFATVLLLHSRSRKVGTTKFWLVMSIPIIAITFQFIISAPIIAAVTTPSTDVTYITIFGQVLPAVAGGIIFGLPFWIVSRTITDNNPVRNYLVVASWGMVLLQLAGSAGVFQGSYPPYGLFSVLLTTPACYLVAVGIYSAAISISADAKLRQSIRKHAIEESRMLGDIGTANMEKQIENKVLSVVKENYNIMTEVSGIHPALTEQNVKEYLHEVLNEIKYADIKSRDETNQTREDRA